MISIIAKQLHLAAKNDDQSLEMVKAIVDSELASIEQFVSFDQRPT
jgi:hypothetical protein